ncbi:MAG TPA: hypothetical protein VL404_00895 [Candidatus Eisenbacteria bacterium]|jgi:type II secretory pathway component PulC|nr:hypothetical protein [Candidatus Eisenbacteria bacterium]
MSIINDALRKAQKNDPRQGEPLGRNLEVHIDKRRSGMNWGPVFILLVLLLITAPILAPVFSVPFKKGGEQIAPRQIAAGPSVALQAEPVQLASLPSQDTRQAQFGIEEAPLLVHPGLYPRPNLILSGVVFSTPKDSYCIINDRVVKVGESVQGARVTGVSPDEVKLDYQGETIVLPVQTA